MRIRVHGRTHMDAWVHAYGCGFWHSDLLECFLDLRLERMQLVTHAQGYIP